MIKLAEFEEMLRKLERNREKTTSEERRTIYAKQFQNFEKKLAGAASEVMQQFLLGGLRFDPAAQTDPKAMADLNEFLDQAEKILQEEKDRGEVKRCSQILFKTLSSDDFLNALCERIQPRVWYEAYGAYWVKYCRQEGPYNQRFWTCGLLDDMVWYPEHNVWVSTSGTSFTAMLPPTMELIRKEAKEIYDRSGIRPLPGGDELRAGETHGEAPAERAQAH